MLNFQPEQNANTHHVSKFYKKMGPGFPGFHHVWDKNPSSVKYVGKGLHFRAIKFHIFQQGSPVQVTRIVCLDKHENTPQEE